MPSVLTLPQKFTVEGPLKGELERMSAELDRNARATAATAQPVPLVTPPSVNLLAFGQFARVIGLDGVTTIFQLPRPDPANIGKRCGIIRLTTNGEVLVYASSPRCFVAGEARYRLANDLHFVEFIFDGNYYPSRAGAGF